MDEFICALNLETLRELQERMERFQPEKNAYKNLNTWLDAFVAFVLSNANRWFLLYNFHLKAEKLPHEYKEAILRLLRLWEPSFNAVYSRLNPAQAPPCQAGSLAEPFCRKFLSDNQSY